MPFTAYELDENTLFQDWGALTNTLRIHWIAQAKRRDGGPSNNQNENGTFQAPFIRLGILEDLGVGLIIFPGIFSPKFVRGNGHWYYHSKVNAHEG